ncbi:hypothetical protein BP1258A_5726 [Burkholderia pseudomallei 1258a]|nr:hypothetical protein BP1258A_5726 [Burkholderia pseudomallei 1258a]EIF65326.1 hypothetical protein BP1258B_2177 [Burkholderia pseudomallei 1258b]EIF70517.1 hypothetical protein BP354E_5215 [Burkholderia pseudomallei 354e]EIF80474.1 hypothetical protein BP354A_2318 [Burkholderia pseudomallei 354a]
MARRGGVAAAREQLRLRGRDDGIARRARPLALRMMPMRGRARAMSGLSRYGRAFGFRVRRMMPRASGALGVFRMRGARAATRVAVRSRCACAGLARRVSGRRESDAQNGRDPDDADGEQQTDGEAAWVMRRGWHGDRTGSGRESNERVAR